MATRNSDLRAWCSAASVFFVALGVASTAALGCASSSSSNGGTGSTSANGGAVGSTANSPAASGQNNGTASVAGGTGGASSNVQTPGASGAGAPTSLGTGGGPSPTLPGNGGASGGLGSPDAGGVGGNPGPASYPMLQASQIGTPVQVMVNKTLTLAESPLWDSCHHQLLFPDVTASVIYALDSSGQLTTFASNTNNANGMAFDIDGSLILSQMGGKPGHIARLAKSGTITVIDPPGSPAFHTPDDVVVRSDGTIYFSDGDFYPIGNLLGYNSQLPVYQITPGSASIKNAGTVSGPNGIELSPDEKTLYVDGYGDGTVWTFSVAPDGTLTKGPALATGLASPDSLCLDAAGNLYVGVKTGLQVLRPDGSKVALIPVTTTQGVTNCTFGGDDGKTLFITAWTALWKVDGMPIPGLDFVVGKQRLQCGP